MNQQQSPHPPQAPAPYQPPQGPKLSWFARHKVLTVIGALVLFFVAIAIGRSITDGGSDGVAASGTSAAAPVKAGAEDAKNGLVTVYDKDGEILTNGTY
jgi:hypothetical protein